jgi:hypothetical protein
MNPKFLLPAIMIALGSGIYIGKLYFSRTETIEVEKEQTQKNVVTIVKEVVRPDGSRETETTTTDKSKETKDTKSSVSVVAPPRPDWHLSVAAQTKFNPIEMKPIYGVQIERRILGPFSAGISVNTERSIGLVVGYEF